MPIRFRLSLAAIAAFSHAALLFTGQMPLLPFLVSPITVIGYARLILGRPQASRTVLNAAAVATLVYFLLDATVISGDVLLAVGSLTLAFHAIKSFDIRNPADGLQVFFMSVIQVVVASELEQPVVFAVIFLLFIGSSVLFTMSAYQAATVRTMPKGLILQAGKLTAIVLPIVLLLFVALPRLTGGLLGNRDHRQAKSGFENRVRLGTFEKVITSQSVVMRITLPDGDTPEPYWRGKAFETYVHNTWEDHWQRGFPYRNRDGVIQFHKSLPANAIRQDILLIPPKSGIVFGIRNVARIRCDSRWVVQYPNGTLAVSRRQKKRIRYELISTGAPLRVNHLYRELYLQLPPGMDRIRNLARQITAGIPDPIEQCRAIVNWLQFNCTYSLSVPEPAPGDSPIEAFLFSHRKGYCEYYATAMVLMLRSLDIPARVVAGYHGGEYNPFGGYYVIRQAHAHTWVEAAIGIQWLRFDPTPPIPGRSPSIFSAWLDLIGYGWDRYVVGYSGEDRTAVLRWLRPNLSISGQTGNIARKGVIALAALMTIFAVIRSLTRARYQRRRRPARLSSRLAARLLHRLPPGKPTHLRWRDRLAVPDKKVDTTAIRTFLKLYEQDRFAAPGQPRPTREMLKKQYRAALNALRRLR